MAQIPQTFIPKLKKGQLVEAAHVIEGVRKITAGEVSRWYEERALLKDWCDDAGESRLPPQWAEDCFSPGRKFTVLRAAASVRHIWYGRGTAKYTLLLCTQTGHEYFVNKKYLRGV